MYEVSLVGSAELKFEKTGASFVLNGALFSIAKLQIMLTLFVSCMVGWIWKNSYPIQLVALIASQTAI